MPSVHRAHLVDTLHRLQRLCPVDCDQLSPTRSRAQASQTSRAGPPLACCRKGGRYFYKRDRGFYQHERPHFLAVEDPQDVTNDLARGSYNVEKVPTFLGLPSLLWPPVQTPGLTASGEQPLVCIFPVMNAQALD